MGGHKSTTPLNILEYRNSNNNRVYDIHSKGVAEMSHAKWNDYAVCRNPRSSDTIKVAECVLSYEGGSAAPSTCLGSADSFVTYADYSSAIPTGTSSSLLALQATDGTLTPADTSAPSASSANASAAISGTTEALPPMFLSAESTSAEAQQLPSCVLAAAVRIPVANGVSMSSAARADGTPCLGLYLPYLATAACGRESEGADELTLSLTQEDGSIISIGWPDTVYASSPAIPVAP
jgi:hypothetical protein